MDYLLTLDFYLTYFIQGLAHPKITPAMAALSWVGTWASMLPATITGGLLLFFLYRRLRETFILGASMLSAWSLIELTKAFFQRPRPLGIPLVLASGYSFPSGHALITVVFFGLLFALLAKKLPFSLFQKRLLAFFLSIFLFLIGLSRIYLGVHYLSDVLFGWGMGVLWFFLWYRGEKLFFRLGQGRRRSP